jgi:hypothetical protein
MPGDPQICATRRSTFTTSTGKFPGAITTIVLPGYVQARHIDTEYYYHTRLQPGACLDTHAGHMQRWHGNER